MDRDIVETKLESLRRCIEWIAAKTPSSVDPLSKDPDLQDIIALNLQRAIQLSVDMAAHVIADTAVRALSTMAENFEILKDHNVIGPELATRLTKAVGFRNIAVHSYQGIDWKIVFLHLQRQPRRFPRICEGRGRPNQTQQAVTSRLEV